MIKRLFKALTEAVAGKPLAVRSSHWEAARKRHLKAFPTCAACGCVHKLQVHHIKPFHSSPELELDPNNLITLCEGAGEHKCHLNIGHLGNFKNQNPNVIQDAEKFLNKVKNL